MGLINRAAKGLVKLKYKVRKAKGIPEVSNKKMRQFHQLYSGIEVQQEIFVHESKQLEGIIKGLLLLFFIMGILFYLNRGNSYLQEGNYLERPSPGEMVQRYELEVLGFPNKAWITLEVEEKEYEKDDLEIIFPQIYDELVNSALGNNESWDSITQSLKFSGTASIDKIKAEWEPEDPEVIAPWGEILKEDIPIEGHRTYLDLKLTYGEYEKTYRINCKLMRKPISEEERNLEVFKEHLQGVMELQKGEEKVQLPDEFEEFHLSYKEPYRKEHLYFILLGAAVIILNYCAKEAKLTERVKNRNTEMLLDYSEIVAKLTILIDCGMTIKGAFKKIVNDYMLRVEQGDKQKRYAYEEMCLAVHMMENGIHEGRAYGAFADRCRLYPYIKLGRLLEQNIKIGNKHLKILLEDEVSEAFASRKNLAKRLGEEAGTKLLMPMIIMLFLVLVIILVPAFLTFSL